MAHTGRLNEEQRKLAQENEGIIWGFITKYGIDITTADDIYGLLAIEYCHAVMDFIPGKNSLSTLAYKYMFNGWQKHIVAMTRDVRKINAPSANVISLDAEILTDDTNTFAEIIPDSRTDVESTVCGKVDAVNTIGLLWERCSKKQKYFLTALYDEMKYSNSCDFNQSELGRKMGVCGEAVRQQRMSTKKILQEIMG